MTARPTNPPRRPTRRRTLVIAGVAVAASVLAACGGSGSSATATTAKPAQGAATASSTVAGAVLPVDSNPITNTATAATLRIEQVLVENNVDQITGKVTDDHLEIQLSNSGATELAGVEIYYTYHDPQTTATENYYAQLPPEFTIPAGGARTIHFDDVNGLDHYPVNKFSLYYTDKNALEVTVEASADGAAVQTTTVNKDAGGAETAD